jgi:hypothetical protein
MTKGLNILFAVTVTTGICSCSTMNVRHVDNYGEIQKSEGIYYSLPKTVITVAVTVEKTNKVKGPFAAYASKYLGLTDVISDNSTSYALSSVKLGSYSIPDPEQYYFIETGKLKKKHMLIDFSENGLLTGINDKFLNKYKYAVTDSSYTEITDNSEISEQSFINPNIAEAFDTIIEKINLDSTVIVKKTLKKVYVEKTTEQKAKEAADFIMKIEESRISLLTGYSEVNYTKEAIEYMSAKLEKMEEEYIHLFTGITIKREQKYNYTYTPSGSSTVLNTPLFRFSDKYGVCDTSDYKGEPVYMNIEPTGATDNINAFEAARMDTKEKYRGIYYRIPEKAKITLISKEKEVASCYFQICQFGVICELQAKGIGSYSFSPETGAVKKIVYGHRRHMPFQHH